ncbi:MAG: hypothetical protein K2O29_03285 [Ruminococcus sp.]|nr:hypothetical protein [Ruminococcus sp.]MDE7137468.1 hypothetical protein [Ruminococcus sp.]
MNKLPVFMTAAVLAMSAVTPFCASAESAEDYVPVMYLSVEDNDKISVLPNGTVYINTKDLTEENKIRVNVYIRDDSKSCWTVAPKVKSADMYIKFTEDAIDPAEAGENSPYDSSEYGFYNTRDEEYNVLNMSFTAPMSDMLSGNIKKLPLTSDATDDYPLAYFNASVDSDIPSGKYRIYFLTESEDYADQRITQVSLLDDEGNSVTVTPEVKEQKIVVSDRMLGDVNNDGLIDTVDATAIMMEYARLSAEKDPVFETGQSVSADVNDDNLVDTVDAAAILSYYAYLSADKEYMEFVEYLASYSAQ